MPISTIDRGPENGISRSQLSKALLLHGKICVEFDTRGFTREEVMDELGDQNGKLTLGWDVPVKIDGLLTILVQEGYITETGEDSFEVLRELPDVEEAEEY